MQRCKENKACGVNDSGEKVEVAADVVVAAMGAQPAPLAPKIYTIGDCRQAGKIMQAVHDGNRVGRMI